MKLLPLLSLVSGAVASSGKPAGGPWDRIGPWNIFDDKNIKGEAGTLASAASPKANPSLIYAGGHNNGVSSGIIKTVDGGTHWTRVSNGLWDTRILGVWIHPSDPMGSHVFTGTQSGIYESTDGAASWHLRNETSGWGSVMSFRQATIKGAPYVIANTGNGIATMPLGGGPWVKNAAPGGIAPNAYISSVTTAGATEVLTCIGGWGGGVLYYASFDSPSKVTWTGPITTTGTTYTTWATFPDASGIYDRCPTPTSCTDGWHDLGTFDTVAGCQAAVNSTTLGFKPAAWTYQSKATPGGYGTHCYASDSFATYSDPTPASNSIAGRAPGVFPGQKIDCANAAVDPNDRNHFIYSEGGSFNSYWESFDGGKTVAKNPNHNTGVYFTLIDGRGWMYTATQAGAFVTQDKGKTWNPYHAIMYPKSGGVIDRVPHDYQNIIPEFRGDNVAFPSDQGLHIVNPNGSYTLINAIGDMHNTMSLSALISPSEDGKSRNIASNIWDWDVAFSRDDGATWSGWNKTEASPGSCGEGGGGTSMGTSGYQVMTHHSHWYFTADGGRNYKRGNTPGTPGGGFTYVRKAGSSVEPAGTCYMLLSAPAPGSTANAGKSEEELEHEWHVREKQKLLNYSTGMASDAERAVADGDGNKVWLMVSEDFGNNWTWTVMPDKFQAGGLFQDPSDATSLFGMTSNCLSRSTDKGKTWSTCMSGDGLKGPFSKLVIKDSKTMFMMRSGQVPLRTKDGGATWTPLTSAAPLFKYGATFDLDISWSGKTIVMHGGDLSAIARQEYGTAVWKSSDEGETWTDETGDLVTISPGGGVWYEEDFYFVTRGEGITVKRNFDQ